MWKPFEQTSQMDRAPENVCVVFVFVVLAAPYLPGCLQVMQALESGDELPGLTRSIIRPLGKLGIVGKLL